jgi:hypothetical protein
MDRIGPYEIQAELGKGGMAVVYRAHQPALDRTVAIKVMLADLEEDPTYLARFQREARAAARMDHPSIVTVYDYGEHEGKPYLVMQYVPGGPLSQRLRAGPLPPEQAVAYIGQVAEALDYAHQEGFVHRDVKPGNILLSRDGRRAILSDFGIVRPIDQEKGDLTTTGASVGTPDYMSPEQAVGDPLDGRSDLYSLAVVLFHALSGQLPFPGTTPTVRIAMMLTRDPPNLLEVKPDLPPTLAPVLQRALARDREQRYQDGAALKAALDGALVATSLAPTDPYSATAAGAAGAEAIAGATGPATPRTGPVSGGAGQRTPATPTTAELTPTPTPATPSPPIVGATAAPVAGRRGRRVSPWLPWAVAAAGAFVLMALLAVGAILLGRSATAPATAVQPPPTVALAVVPPVPTVEAVAPPVETPATAVAVAPPAATAGPAAPTAAGPALVRTPARVDPPAGAVLITDTFADNRNGWPLNPPAVRLEPGRLLVRGVDRGQAGLVGPPLRATDVIVDAELQRLSPAGPPGGPVGQIGVFARLVPGTGLLMYSVADDGRYTLRRLTEGSADIDVIATGSANVNRNGKNLLRLALKGRGYRVELNGVLVGQGEDQRLAPATGGFGVWAGPAVELAATKFQATVPQ